MDLSDALVKIKNEYENAVVNGGVEAKNNLIRTQSLINHLHEIVKAKFLELDTSLSDKIFPQIANSSNELTLQGFLKTKDQDISVVIPNDISLGNILKTSRNLTESETERILTVNVRSQLSSLAKNFDTLYERTFAEALNLHLRCPKMVLGEFYLIAIPEYDDKAAKSKKVEFKKTNKKVVSKFVRAFNAINERTTVTDSDAYKYERVCLLIVDFSTETPLIHTTKTLSDNNLLEDGLDVENLKFDGFIDSLLEKYNSRFDL